MLLTVPEHGQVVALQQVAAVTPLHLLVMSAVTTATVHIDGKLLTITGDTGCEHLVSEASEVLDKHFNVGILDRNQAALPGPDTSGPALTSNDGCEVAELMEAQEGAALPARVMNSPALVAGAEYGGQRGR